MNGEQRRLEPVLSSATTTADQVLELGKVAAVVEIDKQGERRKREGAAQSRER